MIVIINESNPNLFIRKGDTFEIRYNTSILLERETAAREFVVNSLIIFLFVREDGTCLSPNLSFTFAEELPEELREAINFQDLTYSQQVKLLETSPIKL